MKNILYPLCLFVLFSCTPDNTSESFRNEFPPETRDLLDKLQKQMVISITKNGTLSYKIACQSFLEREQKKMIRNKSINLKEKITFAQQNKDQIQDSTFLSLFFYYPQIIENQDQSVTISMSSRTEPDSLTLLEFNEYLKIHGTRVCVEDFTSVTRHLIFNYSSPYFKNIKKFKHEASFVSQYLNYRQKENCKTRLEELSTILLEASEKERKSYIFKTILMIEYFIKHPDAYNPMRS